MAPYINDILQYMPYHRNIANLKLRNLVVKNWPKMMVTDADDPDGPEVEVFDRLYLLWDDGYLTLKALRDIGLTSTITKAFAFDSSVQVGDLIPYDERSYTTYRSNNAGSRGMTTTPTGEHPVYANSPVTEILSIEESVKYYEYVTITMADGESYTNLTLKTAYDVAIVNVEVAIEAFQFDMGNYPPIQEEAIRKHALIDGTEESYQKRKKLYKNFGLGDIIEENYTKDTGKDTGWNSLDKAWVQFKDSSTVELSENIDDYYNGYKDGIELDKIYTITQSTTTTIHRTILGLPLPPPDPNIVPLAIVDNYKTGNNVMMNNLNLNDNPPTDELFGKFAVHVSKALFADHADPKVSIVSITMQNILYTPILGDLIYDTYSVMGYEVYSERIVRFKVTDYFADTHQAFKDIVEVADNLNKIYHKDNLDEFGDGGPNVITPEESEYLAYPGVKFIDRYTRVLASTVLGGEEYWVKIPASQPYYNGEFTHRLLRVDAFTKAKAKYVADILNTMTLDLTKDKKGHAQLIGIASALVAIALVVLSVVSFGATSWIAAAYFLAISVAFMGLQYVLAHNGWGQAAALVGMFYKASGYLTIMFSGPFSGAQEAGSKALTEKAKQEVINQGVKNVMGTVKLIIPTVIDKVSFAIGRAFGEEAGGIFAGLANLAAGMFGGGPVNAGTVATGTMAAFTAGLKAKDQIELSLVMEDSRLSEDDQEISDKVADSERERELSANTLGGLDGSQRAFDSYSWFDKVDKTEQQYLAFAKLIDNKMNKYTEPSPLA